MKKKFSTLLIAMLVMTTALVGCGQKDTGTAEPKDQPSKVSTVTFGFWGNSQDLSVYQQAAKDISAVYPNIKLEIKQYPSSEQFWNTLPGEIAAGVAPDLIKVSNEGSYEYISKGLFYPMDDLIAQNGLDLSQYNAVDIWKVDGKQYAVPVSTMPAMFLINEDMWAKAGLGEYPKTWEDVQAAAKKLTTKDAHGIIINIDAYHITNYVKSYGGSWGYGKTINSKENVEALQKIFDMYKDGTAVTPKSLGFGWDGEVFANSKAAMSTGGFWYKGYLKDANPNIKLTAVPVPSGNGHHGSTIISDGYAILKDAKNKPETMQAINYLAGEEVLSGLMKKSGLNPSLKSLNAKYFDENPEFTAVKPAIEYSSSYEYPMETKKFTDELVKQVEDAILGGNNKTPQQILDDLQAQFNK